MPQAGKKWRRRDFVLIDKITTAMVTSGSSAAVQADEDDAREKRWIL